MTSADAAHPWRPGAACHGRCASRYGHFRVPRDGDLRGRTQRVNTRLPRRRHRRLERRTRTLQRDRLELHVPLGRAFTHRTDFADGSYLTGVGYGHRTFTGNERVAVVTETFNEPRTIYTSDGTPVAKVRIHFVAHMTIHAGTGEARAEIERFFFTCS